MITYRSKNAEKHVSLLEQDTPEIHLSYHDGAHYNSVRRADDFADGPPALIALGACSAAPAAPGALLPVLSEVPGSGAVVTVADRACNAVQPPLHAFCVGMDILQSASQTKAW